MAEIHGGALSPVGRMPCSRHEAFGDGHYTGASLRIAWRQWCPRRSRWRRGDRRARRRPRRAPSPPATIPSRRRRRHRRGEAEGPEPRRRRHQPADAPRQDGRACPRGRSPRCCARSSTAATSSSSAEVAGPGFINMRLAPRGWPRSWPASSPPASAGVTSPLGDGRSVPGRVRQRQPHRAGDARRHPRRGGRRRAGQRPRRGRPPRRARVLRQRRGQPDAHVRRQLRLVLPAAVRGRRASPDEPYPAAGHAAELLFAEHGDALRDLPADELGGTPSPPSSPRYARTSSTSACTSTAGSTSSRSSTAAPSTRCCSDCATPAASSSATGAVWFAGTRGRARQGRGADPQQRHADVLHERRRVPPRQVREARVRPRGRRRRRRPRRPPAAHVRRAAGARHRRRAAGHRGHPADHRRAAPR